MLRKTLFAIFIIIYLLACPLIILESLGIIIKPGQQKLMTATGLISVATTPEGASIFINDKRIDDKSPAIIRNLSEGTYKIKIEFRDYQNWEKTVSVEKSQVTALENVLLIPQKWEKETLSEENFRQLLPAQDNPFLLLKSGPLLKDLTYFRIKDKTFQKLYLFDDKSQLPETDFSGQKVASLKTVTQSPLILLELENDQPVFLWIDTRAQPPRTENISALINRPSGEILWTKDDDKNLFYLNHDSLQRADLDKKTLGPAILAGLKSFELFDDQIYFIDADNHFMQADYDAKNPVSLTGSLLQLPGEFSSPEHYSLHLFSEKLMIFLNDSGKLLCNKLPYVLIDRDVLGFSRDLSEKQLLFWTKNRIGIIDFGKIKSEGVFDTGPGLRWLDVGGRNIRQAFWVNSGSYVLYRDGNKIKISEANDGPKPFVSDVAETLSDIVYSEKTGKLYFIDQQTHKLTALTILPAREFITFKLPENLRKKEIK